MHQLIMVILKKNKNINIINEHLKKIKNIDDNQLQNHIKEARDLWKERNKIKWTLDFSIITNSGFIIK